MANLIQIKRAITAQTPASLANGELAYSGNTQSESLFIGNPNGGAVTRIGGEKFGHVYSATPGTLTSNATIITNSGGFVDTIKVGNTTINSVVNSTSVALSNSSAAIVITIPTAAAISNGQYYLNANGSYSLVDTTSLAGGAGSNTEVAFNDSGYVNSSAGFTFNKSSNNLTIANTVSIGSATVNSTIYTGESYTANDASYLNGNTALDLQTYADNAADTAYSNATSYADTVAGDAYSNAMSDTLSRNGSYTGNNTFGGTNTVFTSNVILAAVSSNILPTANATYHLGQWNQAWGDVYANNLYAPAANVNSLYVVNTSLLNDVEITGNTVIGNSSSDKVEITARVGSSIDPIANVTYSLGTNGLRWNEVHASNVHSVSGYFDGSVTISGNLIVSGNVTTTNVQSVIISDPLMYLAGNNYSSDLVDIGFAGNYYDGSTSRHTGLFRDASDGEYKLFTNLTQELDNELTVNVADPSFALATLNTYLNSGGLVSNTTTVAITANSSVSVNIAANTLSLSTPLPGTSGGTGLASYNDQDIIVANSSNGFSKLSLGTDGYILQSNGTALIYSSLDGGTF